MSENVTPTLPKYFTSKEATFVLNNEDSRSWWFDFYDPLYGFFVIDYLSLNSPSLEVNFVYANKADGHNRIKEMVDNEGWILLKGKEIFNKIRYLNDVSRIIQKHKFGKPKKGDTDTA